MPEIWFLHHFYLSPSYILHKKSTLTDAVEKQLNFYLFLDIFNIYN